MAYFILNVGQWIWVHFTLISHPRLWPNKPVVSTRVVFARNLAAEWPRVVRRAAVQRATASLEQHFVRHQRRSLSPPRSVSPGHSPATCTRWKPSLVLQKAAAAAEAGDGGGWTLNMSYRGGSRRRRRLDAEHVLPIWTVRGWRGGDGDGGAGGRGVRRPRRCRSSCPTRPGRRITRCCWRCAGSCNGAARCAVDHSLQAEARRSGKGREERGGRGAVLHIMSTELGC